MIENTTGAGGEGYRLGFAEAEGPAATWRFVEPDEEQRLLEALRHRAGPISVQLVPDARDTSGHAADGAAAVVLRLPDEDDVEGHAISIRFPSQEQAAAFQRRLLATGVLAGTLVMGAAGLTQLQVENIGLRGEVGASTGQAAVMDSAREWREQREQQAVGAGTSDQSVMDSAREWREQREQQAVTSTSSDQAAIDSAREWREQREQQAVTSTSSDQAAIDSAREWREQREQQGPRRE